MKLSEILKQIGERLEQANAYPSSHFFYFELAPNINEFGKLENIGKIYKWRASLSRRKLNEEEPSTINNYFGKTPKEAAIKLLENWNDPF